MIERVPKNEICKTPDEVHYLPHRPVIREEKDTTKVRAVFKNSCSMNVYLSVQIYQLKVSIFS